MTSTGGTLVGERRVVTALFCDLVGSTSIAETLDPEDWSELVSVAIENMGRVIARFGGTVTEFAGDGLVALFGAPVAHEDDPYRAVRSGLTIIDETRQTGDLEVRVGIHTGLVVVGDVATGDRNTYSALGDTLNVAARLQSVADPGSVVISAETRRLLGTDVEARLIGPTELKGRSQPVVIYEAVSAIDSDQRQRGLPGLTSPIVGRQEELATLEKVAMASAAGTGRVAAVLGEPGVGKSRLFTELGRRVRKSEDIIWAVGTCVAFDEELPYHLVGSLLLSLAGVGSSESPDVVGKAIEDLLEQTDAGEHATSFRRLIGAEDSDDQASPEALREEYSDCLVAVISGLARHNRLVLVCEDAHWADASSAELIADLIRAVPSLPVLLLLVMRPDRESTGWNLLETARRELAESLTEIRLHPLGEEESRDLISNLLEVESLPPTLRKLVLDKAEGNPFFLEEVVRMLIEGDLVENRGGRWIGRDDVGDLDVPETIEGLLVSRIDMLGADLRRAGRVASVVGRRFSARLFDEVYASRPEDERSSLHPHLAGLESHGMIQLEEIDPHLEFSFRHALIHDVMYRGLLRKERRELHGRVASALEKLYPDRADELAPALARHHAEADSPDRALPYLFTAGRRAMSQGARVEAARFYARAQEILEADPAAAPEDLIDAVTGRLTAGRAFIPAQEAIALVEKVLPLAQELDDPDRLARLYERLIWTRGLQGESYAHPEFRAALDEAHALTPRLADTGTAALLHAMMGGALRSGDEFAASAGPLSQAADALEDVGRLVEASYNAAMLADSLAQIGRFDEAMAAIDRAQELGERSGDPNTVLDADIIRGSIAAEKGDLEEALHYTRRGIEGAETHGNTFCNLAGNFKLADQQLRLGNVDDAITHLEKSTGLAQYCDAGGYEALGQAWLAMARARIGELHPEDFDGPLNSAVAAGSRSMEGLVRLRRAIAFAGSGRAGDASADFERAIELFADYGGLPNLARAHHAYGQALDAAGRADEAVEHLRNAEQIFSELGITPDPATAI